MNLSCIYGGNKPRNEQTDNEAIQYTGITNFRNHSTSLFKFLRLQ